MAALHSGVLSEAVAPASLEASLDGAEPQAASADCGLLQLPAAIVPVGAPLLQSHPALHLLLPTLSCGHQLCSEHATSGPSTHGIHE